MLSRITYFLSNFVDVQEQGCVSHSSAESEIVALDMGLRLDGLPAMTLWDTIIQVLEPIPNEDVDSDKTTNESAIDRSPS